MLVLIFCIFIIWICGYSIKQGYTKYMSSERDKFIDKFIFPEFVFEKLVLVYPDLREDNLKLVANGLRQYFSVCNKAGRKMVAMPSQIVDVAWHAFILHSKEYHDFCKGAFGYHLHHRPFSKTDNSDELTDGIKLAWQYCCEIEDVNPVKPVHTPVLFFIDYNLNIPDANKFSFEVSRYIESNQYDNVIEDLISMRDLLESNCGGGGSDGGDGGDGGGCGGCGG